MLIMVVAFAITVVVTRVYLELSGYPQLGNDTFHLAHALWGGLLLVLSASLSLLYLNEWCFSLSAVLAGIGVGLFIDEIGKFITQNNDYFFPLAAPIIYVSFVLTVFAYLTVRRQDQRDARAEMYFALEELKPLLDGSMDADDRTQLVARLRNLTKQTERPDLAAIAGALLQAVQSETVSVVPSETGALGRLVALLKRNEDRWLTREILRRILLLLLVSVGAVALFKILVLLSIIINGIGFSDPFIDSLLEHNALITGLESFRWYITLLTIESVTGLLYLVAVIALLLRRDSLAVQCASLSLILSLTLGNTLAFYFNQFSVVLDSLGVFAVLIIVLRYRDRFLRQHIRTSAREFINRPT
jgi:hypothetical protein